MDQQVNAKNTMGRDSSKGFSLLELLIVLFIFAVGLSIMVPYFQHYIQDLHLKTAAREIISEIYYLKAKAASENLNYRIDFNADLNSYIVMRENGIGTSTYVQFGNERFLSDFGSGVKMKGTAAFGNNPRLSIRTRGTLEPGHLTLENNRSSTLQINTVITGRVYVTHATR